MSRAGPKPLGILERLKEFLFLEIGPKDCCEGLAILGLLGFVLFLLNCQQIPRNRAAGASSTFASLLPGSWLI